MEQRFRNYSSDSVGSDRVFIEESYYQGMLKAMDHRKGRVYRHIYYSFGSFVDSSLKFIIYYYILKRNASLMPETYHLLLSVVVSCLSYQTGHAPSCVTAFPLVLVNCAGTRFETKK